MKTKTEEQLRQIVRQARRAKGWTQQETIIHANNAISEQRLSVIERTGAGLVQLAALNRLLQTLGIDPRTFG